MKRSHMLSAVFVSLAMTSPLTIDAVQSLSADVLQLPSVQFHRAALEDRQTWSMRIREYTAARQKCSEFIREGKMVSCPSINDISAIQMLLRGKIPGSTAASSSSSSVSSSSESSVSSLPTLTLDDLQPGERSLLRRHERLNECPKSLNEIRPGLRGLCISLLKTNERSRLLPEDVILKRVKRTDQID